MSPALTMGGACDGAVVEVVGGGCAVGAPGVLEAHPISQLVLATTSSTVRKKNVPFTPAARLSQRRRDDPLVRMRGDVRKTRCRSRVNRLLRCAGLLCTQRRVSLCFLIAAERSSQLKSFGEGEKLPALFGA